MPGIDIVFVNIVNRADRDPRSRCSRQKPRYWNRSTTRSSASSTVSGDSGALPGSLSGLQSGCYLVSEITVARMDIRLRKRNRVCSARRDETADRTMPPLPERSGADIIPVVHRPSAARIDGSLVTVTLEGMTIGILRRIRSDQIRSVLQPSRS